jgi:phage terminase small subunit
MTEHTGANSLKDDRHELFCQEYLKDLNITQAGIRAGYSIVCHTYGF